MNISVCILSYNQKFYLDEAIKSVLSQTLIPHEIIVVDDASSDDSTDLMEAYRSRYPALFKLIKHEFNTGVTISRNDALRVVTGEYVCFLDGDDRYMPEKLEHEYTALANDRSANIAFSDYFYIDSEGNKFKRWAKYEHPPQGDVFTKVFTRDFPRKNLFRSELVNFNMWRQIGFYDPEINLYEDFDMRIRLTNMLNVVYCHKPLSEYRKHSHGLSRTKLTRHIDALNHIYRKNSGLLAVHSNVDRFSVDNQIKKHLGTIANEGLKFSVRSGNLGDALRFYYLTRKYDKQRVAYSEMINMLRRARQQNRS